MGIMKLIGGILFLYLIWRNLRDDYPEENLVAYSWAALAVYLASGRLAYGLINWGVWNENWLDWLNFLTNKGFFFGMGFVGMLITSYVFPVASNWKPWSFLEDVMGIIYLFMAFLFVGDFWSSNLDYKILMLIGIMVVGFLTGEYFKSKYRSYSWYHSGKKGFAFFGANLIVGVLMGLWAYFAAKQGLIWLVLYMGSSLVSLAGLIFLADIANKK
ncbi:hypothetical protein KBC75_05865 [Candidatus Shapirobacteria bacterium]|nr:hypothetical protein [Candidatus Shapirobacteria bacterium]